MVFFLHSRAISLKYSSEQLKNSTKFVFCTKIGHWTNVYWSHAGEEFKKSSLNIQSWLRSFFPARAKTRLSKQSILLLSMLYPRAQTCRVTLPFDHKRNRTWERKCVIGYHFQWVIFSGRMNISCSQLPIPIMWSILLLWIFFPWVPLLDQKILLLSRTFMNQLIFRTFPAPFWQRTGSEVSITVPWSTRAAGKVGGITSGPMSFSRDGMAPVNIFGNRIS